VASDRTSRNWLRKVHKPFVWASNFVLAFCLTSSEVDANSMLKEYQRVYSSERPVCEAIHAGKRERNLE